MDTKEEVTWKSKFFLFREECTVSGSKKFYVILFIQHSNKAPPKNQGLWNFFIGLIINILGICQTEMVIKIKKVKT